MLPDQVKRDIANLRHMPKGITLALILLGLLALIPLSLAARARGLRVDRPAINIFQEMDDQPKFKAQSANPLFQDGRGMRPQIAGTVPWGRSNQEDRFLAVDSAYYAGRDESGEFITAFPNQVTVDDATIAKGQVRYEIHCTPCHGQSGNGEGVVHKRAQRLLTASWVQPSSYHDEARRARPVGHIFNTVSHGIRTMSGYKSSITVDDRWAIVAYVRALQISQAALLDAAPEAARRGLIKERQEAAAKAKEDGGK